MKIHVLSGFDNLDHVNAKDLKRLIAHGNISAFKRSDGWVNVDYGSIRGHGGDYNGPERREIQQKPLDEINGFHYCVLQGKMQ